MCGCNASSARFVKVTALQKGVIGKVVRCVKRSLKVRGRNIMRAGKAACRLLPRECRRTNVFYLPYHHNFHCHCTVHFFGKLKLIAAQD